MNARITKFARHAALAAAVVAMPAQAMAAEAPCLTATEVRALTTFAMPSVLTGLIDHCSPQVGAGGFMTTQGRNLVTSYAAHKDAAWPTARGAFFRLAGSKAGADEATEMMAKMPDAALQPFVEGMIGGMIGAKLKPGQCVIADKLMRLLAPLPPENTSELLGTILELAEGDKKSGPGGLAICKS
ncbi:hypothetical protein [Novosphingobium sp. Gsoil 351]|uniref:hypothetical protein n=1 Tax=Novosphingobium sp. Gsoil 351 TaxID=2675225 RepID=UPI0012B4D161|nr:hypothetical protein [Novosphingobium sp. Gsoil 351]QGN53355.1 hypothetical protein GKE62_01110 [Novosphingobium sp. Gsoil 351]